MVVVELSDAGLELFVDESLARLELWPEPSGREEEHCVGLLDRCRGSDGLLDGSDVPR